MNQEILTKFVEELTKALPQQKGEEVIKYDHDALVLYARARGDLPEEIKKSVSLEDIQRDFHPNSNKIKQVAEEYLRLMFEQTEIMRYLDYKYIDSLTGLVETAIDEKEQLISTERMGRQLTASEIQEIGNIYGFDVHCKHIERQYEIPLSLIADNLNKPNFMAEWETSKMIEISNDIARLRANGVGENFGATVYADSSQAQDTSGGDFYRLLYGHSYQLRRMNGRQTYSVESKQIIGKNGHRFTPNKLKATITNGATLLSTMEKLIDLMPSQYRDPGKVKFIMSRKDADLYMRTRGYPLSHDGTNFHGSNIETREMWRTKGVMPDFEGYGVIVDNYAKPYADGGEIILTDPKNLVVVVNRKIETDKEYNARSKRGGGAFEVTMHMYMTFSVRVREAVCIAFSDAKVEQPVVVSSHRGKPTFIAPATSATAEVVSGTTVYPYCDTKNAEIWYFNAAATATDLLASYATATGNEGTAPDSTYKIDLTDPATVLTRLSSTTASEYVFRGFKNGVLDPSNKTYVDTGTQAP